MPLEPLGSSWSLGPDGRDIHDGFTPVAHKTPYAAYWGHDSGKVKTLRIAPNKWLAPLAKARPGRNLRSASALWEAAGELIIAERLRLVTQRIVCGVPTERVLSNVWWPARPKVAIGDSRLEKAFAAFLNSTLGILVLMGMRVPTYGPWVKFKKPVLSGLPVLKVDALPEEALNSLARAFDELADRPLKPIAQLGSDPVRATLDEALCNALGLPDISPLREALAREPVLTGRALA